MSRRREYAVRCIAIVLEVLRYGLIGLAIGAVVWVLIGLAG